MLNMLTFVGMICAMLHATHMLQGCDSSIEPMDASSDASSNASSNDASCSDIYTSFMSFSRDANEVLPIAVKSAIISLSEGNGNVGDLIQAMTPFFTFATGNYTIENNGLISISLNMEECFSLYGGWLEVHQPIFSWTLSLPLPDESDENAWFNAFRSLFRIEGNVLVGSATALEQAALVNVPNDMVSPCLHVTGVMESQNRVSFQDQLLVDYKNITSQRDDFFKRFVDDCNYSDLILRYVQGFLDICQEQVAAKLNVVGYLNGMQLDAASGYYYTMQLDATESLEDPFSRPERTSVIAARLYENAYTKAYASNYSSC